MNPLGNQFTRLTQQLSQGMQYVRQQSIQTLTAFGCRSIDTINRSDHNNTPASTLPDTSSQHSYSSSTSSIPQIYPQAMSDSTPHSAEGVSPEAASVSDINLFLPATNNQNASSSSMAVDASSNTPQDLSTYLNNWVNEIPEEREVRQRVKNQIQIVNGQLVVKGKLDLKHTNISSLPQDLHVGGYLNLRDCTSLTTLPQGLHVGGDLYLDDCTSLTTLPQGLTVGRYLNLEGCTSLTTLPENLRVGGSLNLSHCTSLTELPQSLHVGGNLSLRGCTSLTELPSRLTRRGIS